MARALELVLSLVPRDDATQVRADGVQAEFGQGAIPLDNQVRGITLQALRQRVVTRQVRLQPRSALDVVTVGILSRLASATTTSAVYVKQTTSVVHSRQSRDRRGCCCFTGLCVISTQ